MKITGNDLIFAKVRSDAKIPSRREEDGCYDIYACFEEEFVVIQPHTCKLIPSGIATAFSSKYRLAIRERGSNTKSTLITMSGQVDSGYRGEIFIALYNGNDIPVEISKSIKEVEKTDDFVRVPYEKAIAQFAMEEVPNMNEREMSYQELLMIESERGCGSLGSSNK